MSLHTQLVKNRLKHFHTELNSPISVSSVSSLYSDYNCRNLNETELRVVDYFKIKVLHWKKLKYKNQQPITCSLCEKSIEAYAFE